MSAPETTTETYFTTLDTGVYLINAPCPRCGAVEELTIALRTVLTSPEDDIGSLRVKLKGKAREHDCRQRRLPIA